MADSEKLKRFGLDKVAFLVLLVLGLIIAQFVISSRSSFKLSESISLKGTGLEVAVPDSENWKRVTADFKYENNEFRLASMLQISGNSAITTQWRYFLQPIKADANQLFTEIAASIDGQIESSETDTFGQFTFNYVTINSPNIIVFCGITVLPNGRTLTLEVGQKGVGLELAEKVFKALLASVKYNPDNSLVKGAELLKDFKTSFMSDLPVSELSVQGITDYYRIKDATGNSIGFSTSVISYSSEPNDNLPLTVETLFFASPSYNTFAEQTHFCTNITLGEFDWQVKVGNLLTNHQQITHLTLDKSNVLTVDKAGKVEQITFTGVMIPETLLDYVIADFLKSSYETIYLEAMLSDGRIAPVVISRITSTQTTALLPEHSAAQADFFGAFTINKKMYYDGSGRLVSADVQGGFAYRLERTTRDSLLADFPQWLEKIQQMEKYQKKKSSRSKKD